MVPCLVLGDSIAVGTAAALPVCRVEAVVGISSSAWVHRFGEYNEASLVVISLGANDGAATHTKETIQALRTNVRASRVVWLLPAYPAPARAAICAVAASFGDQIVDTAPYAPPGGLHPSGQGYAAVARQAEEGTRIAVWSRPAQRPSTHYQTVQMQPRYPASFGNLRTTWTVSRNHRLAEAHSAGRNVTRL